MRYSAVRYAGESLNWYDKDSIVIPGVFLIIGVWTVGYLIWYYWVQHMFNKDYGRSDAEDLVKVKGTKVNNRSHSPAYYTELVKQRREGVNESIAVARGKYRTMSVEKSGRQNNS